MKYCSHCNDFVEDTITEKEETYNVLNKHEISVTAKIHICPKCGSELFDEIDDSETLEKVYMKYEAIYGPINPANLIEKVRR
jgi:hypothetical protein